MAKELTRSELPYETYERITGKKWTGGQSAAVKSWLDKLDIKAPVGSEQANNELQRRLKTWAKTQESVTPVASSPRAEVKPRSAAQMMDEGYAAAGRSGTGSMLEDMPKLSTSQKKGLQGMKTSVDTLAELLPVILLMGAEVPAQGALTAADLAPMESRNIADFWKAYRSFMESPNMTERAKGLFNTRPDVQRALKYLSQYGKPY